MGHRIIAATCAIGFVLATPIVVDAGRQSLLEGPLTLKGLTLESVKFHVPGDWMRAPRLQGRLIASGGRGNDIEVYVLRAADLPGWEKGEAIVPLYASGRVTTVELDVALPGPGAYVTVVSNKFSKLSAKQVTGSFALVWDQDPTLPAGEALRGRVRFLEQWSPAARIEARVDDRDPESLVSFEPLSDVPGAPVAVTVRRRDGDATVSKMVGRYEGEIAEIGTVDLHGDGDRDVFFVGNGTNPSGRRRDLVVVCPRQMDLVRLSIVTATAAGSQQPEFRYGDTFADPRFGPEQSFLERIHGVYGGRSSPAPRTSEGEGRARLFEDWLRENGRVDNGPLTIRRLPGRPPDLGPIEARLADGDVSYLAHAGSGVLAYDSVRDEHYAVFHPSRPEAWPTALAKSGHWLAIGTRGEGVAFVDVHTFWLERSRTGGAADTVRTLEVVEGGIRVNGRAAFELPRD